MWEDEHQVLVRSDDADLPFEIPGIPHPLPSFCRFCLASLDPRLTEQVDASPAKRSGDPLDTGPKKEQRTANDKDEPDLDVDLTDFGIPQESGNKGRDKSDDKDVPDVEAGLKDFRIVPVRNNLISLAASSADRQSAIDLPTLGWSGFERLYNSTGGKL